MNHLIAPQNLLRLLADADAAGWQPFHTGIDCWPIYEAEHGGSAAMLLRYQPGAEAPPHRHVGYEHIFVLSGSQSDERGLHPAGSLLVQSPGSEHRVRSDEGCVVLAIWEKRVELLKDEQA